MAALIWQPLATKTDKGDRHTYHLHGCFVVEDSLYEEARLIGQSLSNADERSQRYDGKSPDFLGQWPI